MVRKIHESLSDSDKKPAVFGWGGDVPEWDEDEDERAGGGAFAAFLLILILALAGAVGYGGYRGHLMLTELQSRLERSQTGGAAFPAGAVVAFASDIRGCPAGWIEYRVAAGRAIIGAGDGAGLTPRRPGETGGAESLALAAENLPRHNHSVTVFRAPSLAPIENGQPMDRFIGGAGAGAAGKFLETATGSAGDGAPVDAMPPYLALRYCRKS